jgi:hypothetical protein
LHGQFVVVLQLLFALYNLLFLSFKVLLLLAFLLPLVLLILSDLPEHVSLPLGQPSLQVDWALTAEVDGLSTHQLQASEYACKVFQHWIHLLV